MKRFVHLLLIGCVLLIAACRENPVYNVASAPLNAPPTATLQDIQRAIVRAGATGGWQMTPKEPGYIVATLTRRSHTAVVDIRFDTQTYSITYKDSANLNYDGTNIHSNYNSWIQLLQTQIQNQVAALY
jgi:hypothetical protein